MVCVIACFGNKAGEGRRTLESQQLKKGFKYEFESQHVYSVFLWIGSR